MRAVHLVGCSGGLLTRQCAPQNGDTPIYVAAENGHQEVVKLLVKANANKDASTKVKEGRGVICWAHKRCLSFLLGVAAQQLTGSVLSRSGEPCTGRWPGLALGGLRARSGAGASF